MGTLFTGVSVGLGGSQGGDAKIEGYVVIPFTERGNSRGS